MANMSTRPKRPPLIPILLAILVFVLGVAFLTNGLDIALLNPKGFIANEQNKLLINSTLIMLGFGVPVIATVYFFIWKYRESNPNTDHSSETTTNKAFLLFAWGGPMVIVAIIASLMLPATQQLHPGKQIESSNEQITVQVVALNWKWLFIYPEQNIATVNFAQIPIDTPIRFELTADEAPMNSFWIPHLGGMLYAMTGHVNPLNLIADTTGDYSGGAAEINGRGLAGMKFTTRVSSQTDFDAWVAKTQQSSQPLNATEYEKLLKPSENNPPAHYSNPDADLYNKIVSKYSGDHDHESEHQGHEEY